MSSSILLDTSAFVWAVWESKKIGPETVNILEKNSSQTYLSIISVWEIVIKNSKGKIPIDYEQLQKGIAASNIQILNLKMQHLEVLQNFDQFQIDPFDMILSSQSIQEQMTFITSDKKILAGLENTMDVRK